MSIAYSPLARLASFLTGQRCPGCGAACVGWICPACERSLNRVRLRCTGCALPLTAALQAAPADGTAADAAPNTSANASANAAAHLKPAAPPAPALRCGRCLSEPPPVAASHAAFDYAAPGDRLVQALKFRQRTALAAPLAGLLARALPAAAQGTQPIAFDRILPVPLSPGRERSRGYNQSWELVRRLPPAWGPACWQTLIRTRDTASQMALPLAERERNVRGAFAVQRHVAGLHLLLVDDVMTTGATLFEAARCLRKAGAASVTALALARTP
ncbi:MAG TPA: ComF family protein [Burkholderiaceae bacterium]|nr:ComF family protein [Burkholderiaceae bacterium]